MSTLDLTNLRTMTGGDKALEQMLFQTFITSSTGNIREMQKAMQNGDAEGWKKNAHSLKGAAQNLGAGDLAALALKAEQGKADEAALKEVIAAFEAVRDLLAKESA